MPMPDKWLTWQGKRAHAVTFGKVTVLVFAANIDEALIKIAAIARQYQLVA